MTAPNRFLTRMILFLVAVFVVAILLFSKLKEVFLYNPPLNSMILAVMLFGIGFVTDLAGEERSIEPGDVIAGNETMHHDVLALLKEAAKG